MNDKINSLQLQSNYLNNQNKSDSVNRLNNVGIQNKQIQIEKHHITEKDSLYLLLGASKVFEFSSLCNRNYQIKKKINKSLSRVCLFKYCNKKKKKKYKAFFFLKLCFFLFVFFVFLFVSIF